MVRWSHFQNCNLYNNYSMRKNIAQIYINVVPVVVPVTTELVLKYLMGPKTTLNATWLQHLASLTAWTEWTSIPRYFIKGSTKKKFLIWTNIWTTLNLESIAMRLFLFLGPRPDWIAFSMMSHVFQKITPKDTLGVNHFGGYLSETLVSQVVIISQKNIFWRVMCTYCTNLQSNANAPDFSS